MRTKTASPEREKLPQYSLHTDLIKRLGKKTKKIGGERKNLK